MAHVPIRVLLVGHSAPDVAFLKEMLAASPEIDVVGGARSGEEALHLVEVLDPAVICTRLELPGMNGIELTRAIMSTRPKPILVLRPESSPGEESNHSEVLAAGALDAIHIPDRRIADNARELALKIKVISGVVPFRRRAGARENRGGAGDDRNANPPIEVVAIGASTGGPQALAVLLGALPPAFPIPILCVQHIGSGFLDALVDWLGRHARLKVKIAENRERPQPGHIYFPLEGTHLEIDGAGLLAASSDAPVNGHRPSITMTFKSAAAYYGSAACGVLLTGMGEDGADGLKAIFDAGGLTIAQDEQTSVVFGMPRQAINMGAARLVLPLQNIAATLLSRVQKP